MSRVPTTPHHPSKMKREKPSDHNHRFLTPAKMAHSSNPQTSPLPNFSSSSSLLKDISNSNLKRTPSFSHRRSSMAARRLRAIELEQSQSSRKEQVKKYRSLKSLATSLTAWLNFLFEDPRSCGCDRSTVDDRRGEGKIGKRESEVNVGVESGGWRFPKRQKGGEGLREDLTEDIARSKYVYLRDSLRSICSFDDLKVRMRQYLSLDGCKDVLTSMTQVAKNIDEGRIKMKEHCPIVTDVGLRKKAIKVLMCYNPAWLRIGLYIIFGGESVLPVEDSSSDQEITFLKMMIEKQFFSHAGLAKTYAYNKLVDGLYRPGYFEALGNVLLKRFLLLVLILDKGKCQSSLPIKYGIDGLDGGSLLLFNVHSNIKSSRQMVNDFLSSEVMHGEGNLLAHLVIVGYKVTYQQIPLIEYDFRVTDLFQDIQDGIRLCRAIHLLQQETSILTKVVLPSDTQKKKLANFGIALQYLRNASVPLLDDDGTVIDAEDVANGDKELTLSLLWNMFVHLQLPLLVNKTVLSQEVAKISKARTALMDFDSSSHLDMLMNWMKAVCANYDMEMANMTSLVDGKAMWCLLDFYFRKELHCPCSSMDLSDRSEASIVSMTDTTDAVHNFVLSQKLITLLGNFPEVLQICDLLQYNGACSNRSVIILLVFLCSQLLVRKSKDQLNFHKFMGCHCQTPERRRCSMSSEAPVNKQMELSAEDAGKKFKAVQAWWQEMAKRNANFIIEPAVVPLLSTNKYSSQICIENAVLILQSHFRGAIQRKKYLRMKKAVACLQLHIHALLITKQLLVKQIKIGMAGIQEKFSRLDGLSRIVSLMVDRHSFVMMRKAAIVIQRAVKNWISARHLLQGTEVFIHNPEKSILIENEFTLSMVENDTTHETEAALKTQLAWGKFLASGFQQKQHFGAIIIQSYFRGWVERRRFMNLKNACVKIQTVLQSVRSFKDFCEYRLAARSAIVVQSHVRGWFARRVASKRRYCIVLIQSHCRFWLARRDFLCQKVAACRIQRAFLAMLCQKSFHSYKHAAIDIQRFVRGRNTRTKLLGASRVANTSASRDIGATSVELKLVLDAIVRLQRCWRRFLRFKLRKEAATVIQTYIRGCIARQRVTKYARHAVKIQAHWKGCITRKLTKGKLLDLRVRIHKSAANVHEGMRIINRLIAALKELKSMKNVSGILHNCATLDMATSHSQKCCERLVDEGAIEILLWQIRSVTRSIPDQAVLKHCMSTLCNLSRYPHLADVLLNHPGSVETILWELLRNKEEGYFMACELLQRLSTRPGGVEVICTLPHMLKRVHALVEDLIKKVNHEKRNNRGLTSRDMMERRLREAKKLLNLITYG